MSRQGSVARFTPLRLFLIAFALVMAKGLFAQVDTGQVLGTVKDQSGAVVPGAKVTLTNEGTTFTTFTTTGPDGTYIFTPVKIGTYTVAAEFQGFQKATRKGVVVNVQQNVVMDFTLQPGQLTQVVEVTGEAPLLQSTEGSVGQVVDARIVNDLPLNGRNFTFLAQLSAGVHVGQPEGRGLNATGSFSANGTRPAQNNYLLDGIDNNIDLVDFLNGTAFVVLPSPDAIAEFKVQTNNYSAEFGRAGGAVLNATIKSGTNTLHGNAWEFVRNDKFDATDFFINAANKRKPEFRLNQFGGTIGGPINIPHVYNGKNRTFFFGDIEFTRIRQGVTWSTNVPTLAEKNSGYTNFQDLILFQSGSRTDLLGRAAPFGTIFDPATTRSVTKGVADPVTGLMATGTGFVRDPFPGNIIPANRLDPNAIKILNLFPDPNGPGIFNNYVNNPVTKHNVNRFDVRVDHNFSEKDQIFARFSLYDEPQLKPGPFGGIADGGAFNQGTQTAIAHNSALSWTRSFSPTLINEARVGLSYIHTGRLQPNGDDLSNIPLSFGVPGVPQVSKNGGLPTFAINGLSQLGSNAFLVSDEFNSTFQFTENLTKIRHSHSFKGGFEFQHIKFSTLQPPWSRGQFAYGGTYTSIPNKGDGTTGRAQLLLLPVNPVTVGTQNGVNAIQGGSNDVRISNMANTDDGHNYYGLYFKDDWKVKPKLTLNLGLRWDYFGYVEENFGAQANFVPGAPFSGAQYLIPIQRQNKPSLSPSFQSLTTKDGIQVQYTPNTSLGQVQKTNFAPRVGFAYQFTPKLVVRGGYGIFYGGFENRGYSPNIGENYPFQFDFHFFNANDVSPVTYPDTQLATFERGYLSIPLDPTAVIANGLSLRGIQFDYKTPYTQGANLFVQYQVTPNQTVEIGYAGSMARHLETFPGMNRVSILLPPGTKRTPYLPFPDFGENPSYAATEGSSYYHSLELKFERRFNAGLNVLANYTYSKVRSDARDLLNGGGDGGFRNPYLAGRGIQGDYYLANFDIRNVVHLSGIYELPLGQGKHFLTNASSLVNRFVGGWSTNWALTLQDGQPFTIGCPTGTSAGTGCFALLVPGANIIGGPHNVTQWMNPAAFAQPPAVTSVGQTDYTPLGGAGNQVIGPGFHRMDLALFKRIVTSERTYLEFHAEFFNLTNTPNFAFPSRRDFRDTANFGRITATRDNPDDQREIQFALKFYF